jgi:hypothetical protein
MSLDLWGEIDGGGGGADWWDPFTSGGGGDPWPWPSDIPIVVPYPVYVPVVDPVDEAAINDLTAATDALSKLAQKIKAALQGLGAFLWKQTIKNLVLKIWDAIKKAQEWLERHLRPLIDFLKRLQKLYRQYYNRYLRPMLLMIQHVRQYLQILSLLHIKIAQKLDAYLANLQAKLVHSFATVMGTINLLVDISNALVDPRYLIRKPALLLSIRRQLPALIHAITGRPPGYWFPSPKGSAGGPFAPPKSPLLGGDPLWSAPTSSYLSGDDGIGDLSGFADVFTFTDGSVDQVEPLDYFNEDMYPDKLCEGDAFT